MLFETRGSIESLATESTRDPLAMHCFNVVYDTSGLLMRIITNGTLPHVDMYLHVQALKLKCLLILRSLTNFHVLF